MTSNKKKKIKESQVLDKRKNFCMFLGKIIKHKMIDKKDVKYIWYPVIVTQVLGYNLVMIVI